MLHLVSDTHEWEIACLAHLLLLLNKVIFIDSMKHKPDN